MANAEEKIFSDSVTRFSRLLLGNVRGWRLLGSAKDFPGFDWMVAITERTVRWGKLRNELGWAISPLVLPRNFR
jgi:hypothetical protein